MLFVCSWLWGSKWNTVYAERLFEAVARNLKQEYKTVLVTDQTASVGADIVCPIAEADRPLLEKPGCLVRMRMFDRAWQSRIGAKPGDRIVNIDVDAVVTGELDPLFDRDDAFTILQHVNSTNLCPFNGSLWMFRAGERHDVWEDFSYEAACRVPFHSIPDDQGWLHHKFPHAAAWTHEDGVYAFKKRSWPAVTGGVKHGLPDNARVVAFPGRDPGRFLWLGWVREHWGGNLLITPDYARENARLHQVDAVYGSEGHLWAYLIVGIARIERCKTILDYGCGKGSLANALADVAAVREYDPGIPGKDQRPGEASDLVVCLDVMEHIEPDCVDDVIADLARLAGKSLFVVVSTKMSKRKLADGRDTHLIVQDDAWWLAKFVAHKFEVRRVWKTELRSLIVLFNTPERAC